MVHCQVKSGHEGSCRGGDDGKHSGPFEHSIATLCSRKACLANEDTEQFAQNLCRQDHLADRESPHPVPGDRASPRIPHPLRIDEKIGVEGDAHRKPPALRPIDRTAPLASTRPAPPAAAVRAAPTRSLAPLPGRSSRPPSPRAAQPPPSRPPSIETPLPAPLPAGSPPANASPARPSPPSRREEVTAPFSPLPTRNPPRIHNVEGERVKG